MRAWVIFPVALLAYIAFGLSVSRSLQADDIAAIGLLQVDPVCSDVSGYDAEIACLTAIQASVQSFGTMECATAEHTIEPLAFIERGFGCCFDRARFIEKAARHYGFDTRHIFLIERKSDGPMAILMAFLPLGQFSHAATEVQTSRGWLGVDLNEGFILTDAENAPLTYAETLAEKTSVAPPQPEEFFERDFHVVIGLYSRHGFFFPPKVPGPEVSWSELMHNFGGAS